MCLFSGFLKGQTNHILLGSSVQISLLIKRKFLVFLIFKKSGKEYIFSSIHIEKYKFIFTAGDSQHFAGNALHIFTHLL